MKVLVVSDSHGLTDELEIISNRHADEVDHLIHCGDSELSSSDEVMSPYLSVKGNCDYEDLYEDEHSLDVKGHTVYITHGHLYNVKMSPMALIYRAKELGAKIAFFGHSHVAGVEYANEVLLLNPGSIRFPRGTSAKTYAICKIELAEIEVTFYELDGSVWKKIVFPV